MSASVALGQNKNLEPIDINSEAGVLKDYYAKVFPLLCKGFPKKPAARYILIPSFSSESAFAIETKNNHFFILANRLSTSYWYAENKSKVKVKHSSAEIDEELYTKISTLFTIVLKQAHKPTEKTMGLDGETSYLSSTINGIAKTGQTWSPDEDSPMGQLVKICDRLYIIGLGKSKSNTELLKQIDQLLTDLQH